MAATTRGSADERRRARTAGGPTSDRSRHRVRQESVVPSEIRLLDTLSSDYVDLFSAIVSRADQASPEEWARAAMEGAPPVGRFLAWRALCRFDLGPEGDADFVAGWKIVDRGNDWIRMETAARHMTANVVFRVETNKVWFATFMRYEHVLGRVAWTSLAPVHRRFAPDLLAGGVRRVLRRRPG